MYFKTNPLYSVKRKNESFRSFLTSSLTPEELSSIYSKPKYIVYNTLILTSDNKLLLFVKKNHVTFYYSYIINKLEIVKPKALNKNIIGKIIKCIDKLLLSEFILFLKYFDEKKWAHLLSIISSYEELYPDSNIITTKLLQNKFPLIRNENNMFTYLKTELSAAINKKYDYLVEQLRNDPSSLFNEEINRPKTLLGVRNIPNGVNISYPELLINKLKDLFDPILNIDNTFHFFDEKFNLTDNKNLSAIFPSFTVIINDTTLNQKYIDSTYLTYLKYDSATLLTYFNENNGYNMEISCINLHKPFNTNDNSYLREIFQSYNNI